MSKEKQQIEEMAKVICENIDRLDGLAEALYNAGYRKQSENTIELPCKVGETVYVIDLFDYEPCKKNGACGDACHYLYAEYGFGYECSKTRYGEKPFDCAEIKPVKIEDIKEIFGYYFSFGKTVFLTKEEAERTLKEAQNENTK